MSSDSADKRRYRRIYFPGEMIISGVVAPSEMQAEFAVKILNLSEGGLFFTIGKEEGRNFQEKGVVLFMGMKGPGPFNFAQKLNMKIKWVCDNAILESIGYGCEFVDPPSGCVDQFRNMVASFSIDTAS